MFAMLYSWAPVILIIWAIYHFLRKRAPADTTKSLQIGLHEESMSSVFYLLAWGFISMIIVYTNNQFGDKIPWYTLLLIVSAIGFIFAYYCKNIVHFLLSVGGIFLWFGMILSLWVTEDKIAPRIVTVVFLLSPVLVYTLGRIFENLTFFKRLAGLFTFLGLFFTTGIFFFFSSKAGLVVIEELIKLPIYFTQWYTFAALAGFLGMVFVGIGVSVVRRYMFPEEVVAVLVVLMLFAAFFVLPEQKLFLTTRSYFDLYSGQQFSFYGVLWSIFWNIVVFVEVLGVLFLGYRRREDTLVTLGTAFLFLLIVIKYFDWFYTFMDKSIFFIGAGILLFGIGWVMEKGRKKVLTAMHEGRSL